MRQAELPQLKNTALDDAALAAAGPAWWAAMTSGDFPSAWRANDVVLAARSPQHRDDPAQPYHLRWVWDGTPVDGATVLVRCYHGLGDTLQFARYLPALRRRAAHVTVEIQPELIPLVALIGGADRLVPFDPAAPRPAGPCDLEIMELSHALRLAPRPIPYLPVPRPASTRPPRIGLCWQAHLGGWRPERSMSASLAAELLIDGIAWQSLQKGADLPSMTPCPSELSETAHVIAGLDLVITVDTMVAHLAGAIGTPVWLLLDTQPDWRWAEPQRGSWWYPSVRKYRQERAGDWGPPLRAIATDLTRLLATGTLEV